MIVSIGTTHPLGAAGVTLDACVASEYGVPHSVAIAAVSAQDERGVRMLHALPAAALRAQFDCLPGAAAYRVGALGSLENVRETGEFLQRRGGDVIFDPVVAASAGGMLYDADPRDAFLALIAATGALVTPNTHEAALLCGFPVESVHAMLAAGETLLRLGARAALVKGGHLRGDPVDVLVTPEETVRFEGGRLEGRARGTGCMLATALACELVRGSSAVEAVRGARAYVRQNIGPP